MLGYGLSLVQDIVLSNMACMVSSVKNLFLSFTSRFRITSWSRWLKVEPVLRTEVYFNLCLRIKGNVNPSQHANSRPLLDPVLTGR